MEEARVWLGEDGIVRIDHGFMADVTPQIVADVARQLKRLVNWPAPLLVKSAGQILVAEEVLRQDQKIYSPYISAIAIYTPSHSARDYADQYISINQAPYPIRAFMRESAAVKWLQQFLMENADLD